MSSQEDIFRQQVVTLLSRCNNDVPTLIKSITRSLNESGRSDVRAETDTTGTVVTVAQSPYHVSAHMTTFHQTLEAIVADAKLQLASVVPPAVSKPVGGANTLTTSTANKADVTKTTDAVDTGASKGATTTKATKAPGPARSASAVHLRTRRSFPSDAACDRNQFPTSPYNGNYLLFRYGGKFPRHANYGFYRQYGLEGQGAVTSEFHNLPTGQRPDRKTVYA